MQTNKTNTNEGQKKANTAKITQRIKLLLEYLNQGLYGQEYAISQILLFTLAKRKTVISGDDKILKNSVSSRASAAFKEFYTDENFSISSKGHILKEIELEKIPEADFFDFVTSNKIHERLVPTENQKTLLFTVDELNKMQSEIKKIKLSEGVKRLILFNREHYTDTKWQDIVHVLQMSAFLNGRDTVYLPDFSTFSTAFDSKETSGKTDLNSFYEKNYRERVIYHETIFGGRFSDCEHVIEPDYSNKNDKICILLKNFYDYINKNCSKSEKESSFIKNIKKAINEKYSTINIEIENRLAEIELFRKEFIYDNIFAADKDVKELFDGLISHISDLELAKTKLKSKYEEINFSFVNDINIGDCIFASGEVKNSNINENDIKQITAVICIKGDTSDSLYGISQEGWKEKTFDEAEKIAESYTGKDSSVYAGDWKIPTIEQLERIYQNREKLEMQPESRSQGGAFYRDHYGSKFALGYNLSGKFWSSTKKGSDGIYFFDFDKGTKDYTSPDHKYNLALIHSFGE